MIKLDELMIDCLKIKCQTKKKFEPKKNIRTAEKIHRTPCSDG